MARRAFFSFHYERGHSGARAKCETVGFTKDRESAGFWTRRPGEEVKERKPMQK